VVKVVSHAMATFSCCCVSCPDCGLKFANPEDNPAQKKRHWLSWVTGLFNWNWNNSPDDLSNRFWRKRKIPTTQRDDYDDSDTDDDDSQIVPDYIKRKFGRPAGQLGKNQAAQLEKRVAQTRENHEQYETSYYSSESDTDRLNLQQFLLLPPLSKHERIQNWIDKLHINMQNICRDSCVSACECKRRKLEQKTELIMSYMIKSGEETKKLQKTLEEHEENENSKLDVEFNTVEKMNASRAEESLKDIQDKLFADITRKESHSMIHLFSS